MGPYVRVDSYERLAGSCCLCLQVEAAGICAVLAYINLLKPTGHVIHQQFNIQKLYALPTLYLRVLYLSENKQRLVPLTT